jgi:MAC/Perforin domain
MYLASCPPSVLPTYVRFLNTFLQIEFHPIFIKDVSQADTVDKMVPLVQKYGTHYYQQALMGGRLDQISVVDSSYESNSTSKAVCVFLGWG